MPIERFITPDVISHDDIGPGDEDEALRLPQPGCDVEGQGLLADGPVRVGTAGLSVRRGGGVMAGDARP